jgi:hypothetical protein
MKKLGIVALAAIMVMGLTFSAHAFQTINLAPAGEANLWDIINGWTTLTLSQNDLQNATVLETLPDGSYTLLNWAKASAFSQTLDVPSQNLLNLPTSPTNQSGFSGTTFIEPASFGFSDTPDGLAAKTTQNQNGVGNQSSGFIFDLGQFDAAYAGQYIVAFEDGSDSQPYGDSDYNDMVAQVVPVPPSVLLLSSGLLGLVAWRRRFIG